MKIWLALSIATGTVALSLSPTIVSAQATFPDAAPPAGLERVAAPKPPQATPKPPTAASKPKTPPAASKPPPGSKPKPSLAASTSSAPASTDAGGWSDPATEQARLSAWRSYYAMRSVASNDTAAWYDLQKTRSSIGFWLAVGLAAAGGVIAVLELLGGRASPQETRSVLSFGPSSLNLSATAVGLILFCLTGLLLNATFRQTATTPAGTSAQTPAPSPSATAASPDGK